MKKYLKGLSAALLGLLTTGLVYTQAEAGYTQKWAWVLNTEPEVAPPGGAIDLAFNKTNNQINTSKNDIKTALKTMDAQSKASLSNQGDALTNSINVLTTQKAISASQLGKAIQNNTQVQVAAEQAIETQQRVKDKLEEYGAKGAGYAICVSMMKRENIVIAEGNTTKAVPNMIATEVTARPGRYSSRAQALAERLALHDKQYCTSAQAASNLCHGETERAGQDLVAQTLFKPAAYDSDDYRAKSAFINNMMGLPDDPISANIAATQQGQAYQDLKRRKDAIKSTALVSLKNIQAEWSVVDGSHSGEKTNVASSESKQLAAASAANSNNTSTTASSATGTLGGSNVPLAMQMKADVGQYLGGGKAYQEWSKSLVSANERGILKEILQVKALRLHIQAQKYKQLARMESMLAANVAAETYRTGMEANIEKQRQNIIRTNTMNMVHGAP